MFEYLARENELRTESFYNLVFLNNTDNFTILSKGKTAVFRQNRYIYLGTIDF